MRKQLGEALNETLTKADFVKLLEAAKGAETSAAAECPECGHAMRVRVPDFKKTFEAFIDAIEQAEGKAAQAVPEATQIVIERMAR